MRASWGAKAMPNPLQHTGHVHAPLAFVLDDEPQVGELVCKVLAASGLVPQRFESPVPFLAQLKIAHPVLVVLDLALGQSDAVEVIRDLEIVKYSGRVLLISGRDQATLEEINQIGVRHGLAMLPVLRKPFRPADIKERLLALPAAKPEETASPAGAPNGEKFTVDLEEALENNWLELWYQPKIELPSLTVGGAEVLVRARHPLYGLVLPVSLLPAAGDPRYHPLTSAVIRRAMADWMQLAEGGNFLKLAVNVPTSVLHAPDFVNFVRKLLPRHPEFPGLIVEVTEDDVIRDPGYINEVAAQLKLYNISTSIDDFGSAYASLSRLLELPCAELKIDRQFVSGCGSDALKRALCQTVVDLAHRFDISVCAEGVDDAKDLRTLVEIGCDMAQGYIFAKPMPLESLIKSLGVRPAAPHAGPAPSGHEQPLALTA
jgi:EAL domain-containing protein (putative c-di-GMP-specific phosphodiesterase class I)/CheY-like chemotaxis protein